jgi:hypothetical protein
MTTVDESPAVARRHYLSWVRDGLGGKITGPDAGQGAIPARAKVTTGLTVNGEDFAGPTLALHGPGDVTGLDPRQVVRMDPTPGTTTFEPQNLALVEFDDPGLPWRLTTAAPTPRGLRPWLVLVVVDTGVRGVALSTRPGRPLPVLTCPVSELPDLSGSASWAHAEVVVAGAREDLATLLTTRPERNVSRLIAPRVLDPGRSYLACVVPAFEHGCVAGRGDVPAGETTEPAWVWEPDGGGLVELPVYHHWTFSTGPDGDFAALARRLRAAVADPGQRVLSYKDADPRLTEVLGDHPGQLPVLPALTALGAGQDGDVHPGYVSVMEDILRRAGAEVTPPFYLAGPARRGPAWGDGEPGWLRELNLDPRLRAAAGLGAEVVRIHQEALMSSAWRQAAELERANRELRQGQLAREVSKSLYQRHFTPPPNIGRAAAAEKSDVVVQRAATALGRLRTEHGTLAGEMATHQPTADVASPEVQRAARPTGTAAKVAGATANKPLPSAVTPVALKTLVPTPPVAASPDTAVLDRHTGTPTGYRSITAELVQAAAPWWRNASTRPILTPGPVGYLTDVVLIREQPAPAWTLSTEVRLGMDFDGRTRWGGWAVTHSLPVVARRPKWIGVLLARTAAAAAPGLMLVGLRRAQRDWAWEPVYCFVPAEGGRVPAATVLAPFGGIGARLAAATIRPAATGSAELVVLWEESYEPTLRIRANHLLNPAVTTDWVTSLDKRPTASAYAVSTVPALPSGQPGHLLVAALGVENVPHPHPVWKLSLATGTPQGAWSPWQRIEVGRAATGTAPLPADVAVSVTDLDGDGNLDLIVTMTFDEPAPDGTPRTRVTRQLIGWGLRPDGTVERWQTARVLSAEPAGSADRVLTVVGDLSDQRLARLAGLGDRFQSAALSHQSRLVSNATVGQPQPVKAGYDVAEVAAAVAAALDPATTVPAAVAARVSIGDGPLPVEPAGLDGTADPLRPRLFEPRFPQAMADPLRELFPDLVFPAVDGVPDNSVALLAGNGTLIAAYLAGLNHEFGRELLWRGFPTTGRATWFRHFFDGRGAAGGASPGDIADIADWDPDKGLAGQVIGPAAADSVILVVRGELLRRYPDLVVQAVRGVTTPAGRQPAGRVELPAFVGRVGADVSLFSFPVPRGEVRGDPGWYFAFAEAPTGSRFAAPADPQWTESGGHTAAGLVRMPFRIAIHASDLVTPQTPGVSA